METGMDKFVIVVSREMSDGTPTMTPRACGPINEDRVNYYKRQLRDNGFTIVEVYPLSGIRVFV